MRRQAVHIRWSKIAWAAAVLFAFVPLYASKSDEKNDQQQPPPDTGGLFEELMIVPVEGKVKAKEISVAALDSGKTVNLSDMEGKVVFLNFWATWCGPCRMEVQDIEQLHQTLSDEEFAVMAVDIQEKADRVKGFMQTENLTFPVYLDSDGSAALEYRVSGIPTTFIIDPEGYIVGTAVGPREWGGDASVRLMRSLMQ
jgi:thiol-disulfide isomerase/thioredoxin